MDLIKKYHFHVGWIQCCFILTMSLCYISCTNATKNKRIESTADTIPINGKITKPPSSFPNDTLVINSSAALFFNPDSLQLEKVKALFSKDKFEDMVHQNFYLMKTARSGLQKNWPRLPIIETHKYRYLLFAKHNGKKACIDLDKKGDIWGILLFDGIKDPELPDMMNIETALRFYFSK